MDYCLYETAEDLIYLRGIFRGKKKTNIEFMRCEALDAFFPNASFLHVKDIGTFGNDRNEIMSIVLKLTFSSKNTIHIRTNGKEIPPVDDPLKIVDIVDAVDSAIQSMRVKSSQLKAKTLPGRRPGSKNKRLKLDKHKRLIENHLRKGTPKRQIAALLSVSKTTLLAWINKRGISVNDKNNENS